MTESQKKMLDRLGLDESAVLGNESEVEQLKAQLSATDYKAIKYAEGWLTAEEYAPIKAEREALREQIRALENG